MKRTVTILTNVLKSYNNPFKDCVWAIRKPITKWEVLRELRAGRSLPPESPKSDNLLLNRMWHIRRVAWFVENGKNMELELDVGVPCLGYEADWMVTDGNHRFAAAIIRGDETIEADLAGDLDYAACLGLLDPCELAS